MKQVPILLLMIGTVLGQSPGSIQPANGFVPDEQTAIRVGAAVMTAVLGRRYVDDTKPIAKLDGDVWTKVHWEVSQGSKRHHHGRPATIQLSRKDGHVVAAWRPEK